ncbi:MAG TPA: cbb3-type cytochrome c oxidase subunit 3 [Woeseiaceae bacterium]
MSTFFGHLVGVVILLLMGVFIGIWFWAWRPRHKPVFDALAEMPMRDADAGDGTKAGGGSGPRAPGP